MSAEIYGNRLVFADRNEMGPWEKLTVEDINGEFLRHGDIIGLRSFDMRFICAELGGNSSVVANRLSMGPWEQLTIYKTSGSGVVKNGDQVYLQTYNGNYLRAVSGGGNIVDATATSVGPWETYTLEYASVPKISESVPTDINGDGIFDEIIKSETSRFKVDLSSWWTACYDYDWYSVNDYFFNWGLDFGPIWGNWPGFSRIWIPDLFWAYYSAYSYCDTYVSPMIEFETEPGYTYQLYYDTTGSEVLNPANWSLVFSSDSFDLGVQNYYLATEHAANAYLKQYFLVKLGKPASNGSELNHLVTDGHDFDTLLIHNMIAQLAPQDIPTIPPPEPIPQYPTPITPPTPVPQKFDPWEDYEEHEYREQNGIQITPWITAYLVAKAIYETIDQWPVSYIVYRKWDQHFDKAYIGRTHGYGPPSSVMARRDKRPDHLYKNSVGYKNAEAHSLLLMYGKSRFAQYAVRGREQIVMDIYAHPFHNRKSVFNVHRGVAVYNRLRWTYYNTSALIWDAMVTNSGDPFGAHSFDSQTPMFPDKLMYRPPMTIQTNFLDLN